VSLIQAFTNATDALKGTALITAFLGFIATCVTWISIWDSTWQAAVEPVRGAFTRLDLIALGLRHAYAHRGCGGQRVVD
jgi:hypothetical protein